MEDIKRKKQEQGSNSKPKFLPADSQMNFKDKKKDEPRLPPT